MTARPAAVGWFERLGLTAAALDFAHLALLFERRASVDGLPLALLFTALIPLFTAALVLATARKRNIPALIVLAALTMVALLTAGRIGSGLASGQPALIAGAASTIILLAAFALLLTPAALRWLRGR